MDQETQRRIQAARDAGYSDAEIQAALGGNVTVVPNKVEQATNVPVLTAEERARLQQEEALETDRRQETSSTEQDTTGASALGMGAAGALGTGALLYAGKKLLTPAGRGATDLAQRSVAAAEEANRIAALNAQQLHERELTRQANRQATQAARAAPVAPQILDAQGRPMARAPVTAPVVPTGPAVSAPVVPQGPLPAGVTAGPAPFTPPQAPSIVDRATNLVRAIAANKVVQGAARMGNMAGIASMVLSPSNSGQNYPFPQAGPLRGSEINPTTGQPWTPQELAQYRAQYGG